MDCLNNSYILYKWNLTATSRLADFPQINYILSCYTTAFETDYCSSFADPKRKENIMKKDDGRAVI